MAPYDVAVIGAGPGGYVCAIRAAQLGLSVVLIDKEKALGGTCLRVGCIPSKALLESSELYARTRGGLAEHGIRATAELDLPAMMKRKDAVVRQLTNGVAGLMKRHGVRVLTGEARFSGPGSLEVDGQPVAARNFVIATGSAPAALPDVPMDGERIVDSTGGLSFAEVPAELVILGGGYIGVEMASIWSRLGSKVTVLELLPRILPGVDDEVARLAQRLLSRQGIAIETGVRVTGATVERGRARVVGEAAGQMKEWSCDRLLVAVGRRPYTEGLNLEAAGVRTDERGRIAVDGTLRTSAPNVLAIGDVVPGPMLAHKASEEGVAAAEILAGRPGRVDHGLIPGVVFTDPEIASVGRTEEQLKEAGVPYRKGSFPFMASGRAKALGAKDGFAKILAHEKTDRILGAHIIGPRAGELIAEIVLAMAFQASAEDVGLVVHAHPTLAEALKEAALGVSGASIHL